MKWSKGKLIDHFSEKGTTIFFGNVMNSNQIVEVMGKSYRPATNLRLSMRVGVEVKITFSYNLSMNTVQRLFGDLVQPRQTINQKLGSKCC